MATREQVLALIYEAVDELNEQASGGGAVIEKSEGERLMGHDRKLDSLSLVQFIVAIEQRLADGLGATVTLADERAMSQKHSPFRSLGTLADYATTLVEESRR